MDEKFKINKEKCVGCGLCVANCPGAIKIGEDGKAEIIDQKNLSNAGEKMFVLMRQ